MEPGICISTLGDISMQNDLDENSTNHIADVPLRYPDIEPFGPS